MAEFSEVPKYVCVIDFEATCIEDIGHEFYLHEIIEFPAVLIDTEEHKTIGSFHSFVKPTMNPELSEFCKNLTGISQDSINNAETFDMVYPKFLKWIYSLTAPLNDFAVLTDGDWDMSKFLYLQCLISNLHFPHWAEKYVDVKRIYKQHNSIKEKPKLMVMLQTYGLVFKGQLHSGKDDAHNIAQLALAMLNSGHYLILNSNIRPASKRYLQKSLAIYLQKSRKKHKRSDQKKSNLPEGAQKASHSHGQMDIDPDLIGSEFILHKHKSK